jgi:hypothetical protein
MKQDETSILVICVWIYSILNSNHYTDYSVYKTISIYSLQKPNCIYHDMDRDSPSGQFKEKVSPIVHSPLLISPFGRARLHNRQLMAEECRDTLTFRLRFKNLRIREQIMEENIEP